MHFATKVANEAYQQGFLISRPKIRRVFDLAMVIEVFLINIF